MAIAGREVDVRSADTYHFVKGQDVITPRPAEGLHDGAMGAACVASWSGCKLWRGEDEVATDAKFLGQTGRLSDSWRCCYGSCLPQRWGSQRRSARAENLIARCMAEFWFQWARKWPAAAIACIPPLCRRHDPRGSFVSFKNSKSSVSPLGHIVPALSPRNAYPGEFHSFSPLCPACYQIPIVAGALTLSPSTPPILDIFAASFLPPRTITD